MWFIIKSLILISNIYTFLLIPMCTIPGLRTSQICSILKLGPPVGTSGPTSVEPWNFRQTVCLLPAISSSAFCRGTRQVSPSFYTSDSDNLSILSIPLDHERFSAPFGADPAALAGTTGNLFMRQLVLLLDDLYVIFKTSAFGRKEDILDHVRATRLIAKDCITALHSYKARLLSSIDIILASSTSASSTATSQMVTSQGQHPKPYSSFLFPFACFRNSNAQRGLVKLNSKAFGYALDSYQTLNMSTKDIAVEVREGLTALDGSLEILTDILYEEALGQARAEFTEVSGRFWTMFGGHGRLYSNALMNLTRLNRAGTTIRQGRTLILDLEARLEILHTTVGELQSLATDPLLLHGGLPEQDILNMLAGTCLSLRNQLVVPLL